MSHGAPAMSPLPGRAGEADRAADLRRGLPFLVASFVPFVALVAPFPGTDMSQFLLAFGVAVTTTIAGMVARAMGAPLWVAAAAAIAYLIPIALVRDAEGGAISSAGPMVLVPLLWCALYGTSRHLYVCIAGICVLLAAPIFVVGGSGYQAEAEIRRTLIWLVLSLLVGPAVQQVVARSRTSEAKFRGVFDTVHEVIFQTDDQGRWTLLNPAWSQITGYEVESSLGQPFIDFVHPDDRAGNAEKFDQLLARDIDDYRYEMRYQVRDGSYRWLEVFARRTTLALTHDAAVGGTLTDITARYEAERLKEQFFALVSHELRTPLAAIVGYLELLDEEEGARLSEDGRHFVDVMQRNSQRLLRLIGDLLFAAQVEAGTLALVKRDVDMAKVITDAVATALPAATAAQLELDAMVVDDAPRLTGDRERLGQVLDNLLGNAIKFTPPGGRIHVSLTREEDEAGNARLVVEVQDTGPGIPEKEQARLFERFARASAAEEQVVQGVGLGLAIARAIVSGHGGTIGLRSTLGQGTTFRVELPVAA